MRDVWNLTLVVFIASCVALVLACADDGSSGEGDGGGDDECTGENTTACLEEREECIDDCPIGEQFMGCYQDCDDQYYDCLETLGCELPEFDPCPGYDGADECCDVSDPCAWADDGVCDCYATCDWDLADCS